MIKQIWEADAYRGVSMAVIIVHDGEIQAKTYVLEEVGIEVAAIARPLRGAMLYFTPNTGAEGTVENATVNLMPKRGYYPAVDWQRVPLSPHQPPSTMTYLKPGEAVFYGLALSPQDSSPQKRIAVSYGLTLHAYVKAIVGGSSVYIRSKKFMYYAVTGSDVPILKATDTGTLANIRAFVLGERMHAYGL